MGRSLNPLPKGKRVARESDRRRSGCLLAALLLLLTAVQVATKAEVGGGVIDRAGLPPLRVGMDPSFVPFEFYTGPDTPAQGYDVDLAREIARRLGQEAVIVPAAFEALPDELRAGRADLVVSAFPYDARLTEDLAFSGAYFNAGPVVIVRAGQPKPETLGALAVELGTAADAAARSLKPPPAHVVRLASPEAVVQAVASGQVDAGLLDMVAALQAGPEVQPVGVPVVNEFYVVAVRKDNQGLYKAVDIMVEALRREGVLDKLARQWMGRAPPQ